MWKKRERLYRRRKTTGADNYKISWKRVRAVARRTFKLAKQDEFRKYVSGMKVSIPAQQIYDKLRKIRGRKPVRSAYYSRMVAYTNSGVPGGSFPSSIECK